MMSTFITVKKESCEQMKQRMYDGCIHMIPSVLTIKVCLLYLMYIVIHYMTPYLYIQLCVPRTMLGFLLSPMMVTAPHCKAIRWIFTYTSTSIDSMWILIGTWLIGCIHEMVMTKPTVMANPTVNVVEE